MPKPQTEKTEVALDEGGLSDGQKLAIKLGLMAATTIAATVATSVANKFIEKKFGE